MDCDISLPGLHILRQGRDQLGYVLIRATSGFDVEIPHTFAVRVQAIRRPSGDQTGFRSSAGSKVNGVREPRFRSRIQMSRVFVGLRASPPQPFEAIGFHIVSCGSG